MNWMMHLEMLLHLATSTAVRANYITSPANMDHPNLPHTVLRLLHGER